MNTHLKSTDSLTLNLFIGGNSPDAKPSGVLATLDASPSVIASAPLPHFRWFGTIELKYSKTFHELNCKRDDRISFTAVEEDKKIKNPRNFSRL